MPEEQAQNTTPDAPQAPTSDVQNGAVIDTTPANLDTAPNEPFDNSPVPLPPTASAPETLAPASVPQAHSGRDLLVNARATIQQRKQKKLEKILQLLTTKGKITNDEVEKLLHVADATATRYLSALEKEGKIQQVGKTGKVVTYTRI